jgi:hypothetical protein
LGFVCHISVVGTAGRSKNKQDQDQKKFSIHSMIIQQQIVIAERLKPILKSC